MAQNPDQHAEDYGLSHDVVADVEPDEGPPLGGQGGETRTRVPEHSDRQDHGPKTRRMIKAAIKGKAPGGTH